MGIGLAVAAGSALGAVARYGLSLWLLAAFGPGFAWGTLAANAIGSFLIGLYAALKGPGSRAPASGMEQAFVVAGFCGGFTTFSIFSLEVVMKAVSGEQLMAAAFLGASIGLWLAGVSAGDATGRRLDRARTR